MPPTTTTKPKCPVHKGDIITFGTLTLEHGLNKGLKTEVFLVTHGPRLFLTNSQRGANNSFWSLSLSGTFLDSYWSEKVGRHYPAVCLPLESREGYVDWEVMRSRAPGF